MLKPKNMTELAELLEQDGKLALLFTADWCGDCHFIYPVLPELEAENPEFTFIQIDRDAFMPLAQEWQILGIPSLVLLENQKEVARLVNKKRKTKDELNAFLAEWK